MIVKHDISWLGMLFTMRRSGLHSTFPRIAIITLVAVVVTILEHYGAIGKYTLTPTPFALIGLALGIFLGFRNNVAYDRYWEGRKLWGGMVNVARSFSRQTLTLINSRTDRADEAAVSQLQRELVLNTVAFAHALRHLLRETKPADDLRPLLTPADFASLDGQRNIPVWILQRQSERLRDAWRHGWIADVHLPVLEASLKEMTDVHGACERIRNTPVPFAYVVLLHQIVAFYCFFLPFGIIKDVGTLTPVVVMLISHAFFGLDEIGDEIEEPFGTQPHHLPLTTLCRTIEINLRQQLGDGTVPEPLVAVDDVLL